MALVSDRSGAGTTTDRGQLLFVTALGLAVLLVVLAVSLNATVDTGGGAPDGTATDPGVEAIRYQEDAENAVGVAMANANDHDGATYADLETKTAGEVRQWSNLSARLAALDGTLVGATVRTATHGTRLAQTNDSRAVTNVDGNASWTLVSGVDRLRAFELRLNADSLETVSHPSPTATDLENDDVFTVVVDGDADRVRVFVYRNDSGAVLAAVAPGDGSLDGPCEVPTGPEGTVTLDLTAQRAAGTDCPALDAFDGMAGPYSVQVRDGTSATGAYSFVVDAPYAAVDTSDYAPAGDAHDPTASRALYATTVSITADTSALQSTVDRRVAPGEFDD